MNMHIFNEYIWKMVHSPSPSSAPCTEFAMMPPRPCYHLQMSSRQYQHTVSYRGPHCIAGVWEERVCGALCTLDAHPSKFIKNTLRLYYHKRYM